ncbi:MAG: hypothetical protein IKP97_01620 [Kiritimatiellae bacterium]|nr:hypothetical protein [Kiritimatiellia bacterium]
MSIDVNAIHNTTSAIAAMRREENNRGKKVNQAGWKNKEQMRKEAAQMTIGVLLISAFAAIFLKFFTKIFGKVPGAIMAVLLFVSPIWGVIESEGGQNITWLTWLPLLVIVSALVLKLFTKLLGRKWGLRIGVSILCFIGLVVYLGGDQKDKVAAKQSVPSAKEQVVVERQADSVLKSAAKLDEVAMTEEPHKEVAEDEVKVEADQAAIEQYFNEARNKVHSLAAKCSMELRENGSYDLISSVERERRLFNGVIHSTTRLTYEQAKATIDNALDDCINKMDGICDRAKAKAYLDDMIARIENQTKSDRRYGNSSESSIRARAAIERLGDSVIFKLRQMGTTSYQDTKARADAEYANFIDQIATITDDNNN